MPYPAHPASRIARLGRDIMLLTAISGIVSGLISLVPFGVFTNIWLGNSDLASDATFSQGPGSAFFSSSVTIAIWMVVFFNIRRGRWYISSAAQLFQHVSTPTIADVSLIGGEGGGSGAYAINHAPPLVYTQVSPPVQPMSVGYAPSFAPAPASYVPPSDLDFHSTSNYTNHASY